MRLIVSGIPEDGLRQELDIPVTINDSAGPDIAHVLLKIFRIGKKVLVEGSLKMAVSLKCGRCLRDISHPLDIAFREEYNPAEDLVPDEEDELSGELDLSYYRDDEIDISELVKEQILLSVPMKPLCDTECKGICPNCGKDLNETSCECRTEDTDPRLSPLKKFRELIKERKE